MPQRPATSFDDDLKQARADFEKDLELVRKPIAKGEASVPGRHPAVDVGIGAAKGLGRTAIDLSKIVNTFTNPLGPSLVDIAAQRDNVDVGAMTTPTNAAQSGGAFAADLLTAALPGGAAARGGNTLKNMAARQWQVAAQRPIREPLSVARGVLDEGLGRLTRDNAIEYARRFPHLPPETLRSIDRSVQGAERAVNNPGRSLVGMLTSPGARAAAAQGVNTAAPALSAVAGGGGGLIAQALLRLLGGQ